MNSIKDLKKQAVGLRLQGDSYNEIGRKINVPKSTLSSWLKEIKLTPEHQKRLYTKQINILSRGPRSQKERRAKEVAQILKAAESEIKLPISDDIIKFLGVGLYWAEGTKSKLMQFTNSDPYLILFMVKWLNKIFNIDTTTLRITLNLYQQQNENDIKVFWSEITGIPITNFGKTYIKPKNKGFKKNNLYYGTARVYVPKSTNHKYRMLGWLNALLENDKSGVESVQERWTKLKNAKRSVNL